MRFELALNRAPFGDCRDATVDRAEEDEELRGVLCGVGGNADDEG